MRNCKATEEKIINRHLANKLLGFQKNSMYQCQAEGNKTRSINVSAFATFNSVVQQFDCNISWDKDRTAKNSKPSNAIVKCDIKRKISDEFQNSVIKIEQITHR